MRKQRKFSIIFLIILSFLFFAAVIFAASPNSCVTCHTNENLMKALHKPPPMPAGEGEG